MALTETSNRFTVGRVKQVTYLVLACVVSVMALPTVGGSKSEAATEVPALTSECFSWDSSPRYRYSFVGAGWTTGPSGLSDLRYGTGTPFNARAAVQGWNEALHHRDGRPVGVTEQSGGVEIEWSSTMGTTQGLASCSTSTKRIRLNVSLKVNWSNAESADYFRAILQHEFGHTLRLAHSGESMALESADPPIMATCMTGTKTRQARIRSDDLSAFNIHQSAGIRNAMSNGGFEKGLYAWAPINGMQVTHFTSGGRTGGDWLRVR